MVLFEDEFKKHKRDWLVERIKQQGADRLIQTKIAAHFKTFDFRNAQGQTIALARPLSNSSIRKLPTF